VCMKYFFILSFKEKEHCSAKVKKAEGIDYFLNQLQHYLFFCVFDSYKLLVMTSLKLLPFG